MISSLSFFFFSFMVFSSKHHFNFYDVTLKGNLSFWQNFLVKHKRKKILKKCDSSNDMIPNSITEKSDDILVLVFNLSALSSVSKHKMEKKDSVDLINTFDFCLPLIISMHTNIETRNNRKLKQERNCGKFYNFFFHCFNFSIVFVLRFFVNWNKTVRNRLESHVFLEAI